MEIDRIIADPPLVHSGGKRVLAIADEVLRYLEETLPDKARTIETGIGSSTVFFAARSARHIAITASADEVDRLRAYCAERGIDLDHVDLHSEGSQTVLPQLTDSEFDLALIDGGHGFPMPFIDWFYMASHLRVGGRIIIDDVPIWTGTVLRDVLREDPRWRSVATLPRAAVFELLEPFRHTEWNDQPYVRRKSRLPLALDEAGRAVGMVMRGEFGRVSHAIKRRLTRQ